MKKSVRQKNSVINNNRDFSVVGLIEGSIFKTNYENAIKQKKWQILKKSIHPEYYPDRTIINTRQDLELPDNKIKTNKYTIWSFLPKNLYKQFSRLANIYFVFIALLESIPEISNSDGTPVTLIPLLFIVLLSALQDIFEDLKRYKSDQQENNKQVLLGNTKQQKFIYSKCQHLRVGDIIKIHKEEYIPADLLIISTSDQQKGICFVETKNLDGETNLKYKNTLKNLSSIFMDEASLFQERFLLRYEKPSNIIYNFKGLVEVEINYQPRCSYPVNNNNIILRGCSLKNTEYIYGMVIYTGHHTKIMLNSVASKPKSSTLEKTMNKQILIVFIVQLILCIICSVWYTVWVQQSIISYPYIYPLYTIQSIDMSIFLNIFLRYGNWALIFTNFVPISLLVTLEMVRFTQGLILSNDKKLYSKVSKTKSEVQTSSLNEELGQVEYIFSDKTGTLTCNVMQYKKICINGISYGEKEDMSDISIYPSVTNVDFRDSSLFVVLSNKHHPQYPHVKRALLHLSLNHTALLEIQQNGNSQYNASSPDELALVNFAKFCGVEYMGIDDNNIIKIQFQDEQIYYKLLYTLEFNSTRKRNSIIIQNQETNQIYLLCKGADSVLLDRIKSRDSPLMKSTLKNLEKYGSIGLRTLMLSDKLIRDQDFIQWQQQYEDALKTLEDRDEAISKCQDIIEQGLDLVGATAIEDKLQDDVGVTIFKLKQAGIKVWVLTGDKLETAINISFSCNLISSKTVRLTIDAKSEQELVVQLQDQYSRLCSIQQHNQLEQSQIQLEFALVITGEALTHGLKSNISYLIMRIAEKCRAVICCRVSPKQKAQIVKLVRENKPQSVTLAIGDGANDVNMINAAHVGIGIKGLEGYQAARAADFVIGEFKFLRRLLLYYGRENYRRNANLICYNFYKNVLLVLPQFWYGFLNMFSGVQLYEAYLYQFFNICFTSVPIYIYAIYDSEYSDRRLESQPLYYIQGIKHQLFGYRVFWTWFIFGVWQAIIVCYVSYFGIEPSFQQNDASFKTDFWMEGILCLLSCVLIANLKIFIISYRISIINILVILLSIGLFILGYYLVNISPDLELYLTFVNLFEIPYFYISIFVIIILCISIDSAHFRYLLIQQRCFINEKILKERQEFELQKLKISQTPLLRERSLRYSSTISQEVDELVVPSERQIINVAEQWSIQLIQQEEIHETVSKIPLFNNLLSHRGFDFSEAKYDFQNQKNIHKNKKQ